MTIFVQHRLQDADAVCERAEELISRHYTDVDYVNSLFDLFETRLEEYAADPLTSWSVWRDRDVVRVLEAIHANRPSDWDEPRARIELSALAHQRAMQEADQC